MKQSYRNAARIFLIFAVALTGASITRNANAQAPNITVTPIWHPGTQLSTLDANNNHVTDTNDDLRYVDLELDVTTNVQFWGMEITCTVNKAVLESYVQGSDPNGTGDDVPVVTWSPVWRVNGALIEQPFNTTTGAKTIAAANAATEPLGQNGITSSFPLATIRYRVKPVTTAMTSTLTCTGSFLNTDGNAVMTPVFVMPPALSIIPAFTISGNVSYQARTQKQGISVQCVGPATYNTTTDVNGNFTIPTRIQGSYTCTYTGNTITHDPSQPDLYIKAYTVVPLNTLSYKILPTNLSGGNLDRSNTIIDSNDLVLVTSNYNVATKVGDVTGDGKTDKSDLTLVTTNLFVSELDDASHIMVGATLGLVTNGSRIWTIRNLPGRITQQVAGSNVDNWPAVSPDGSKLIVTRRLGSTDAYRYALFIMNPDGSDAQQLTPTTGANGNFDAFAASWSPDGTHIAYNCAAIPAASSWELDDSSLCLIDATGRNFRVVDNHVHIYPPAWLNSTQLLYSGNSKSFSCPSASLFLCHTDINSLGDIRRFLVQPGANVTYVDMPVVSDGAVFYRAGLGTAPYEFSYRMADLDGVRGTLAAFPSTNAPLHVEVEQFAEDYYTVRPGSRDVMTVEPSGFYAIKLYQGAGRYNGLSISPFFGDMVGDPDWNFVPESFNTIYGLRNAFTWVP